MFYSKSVTLRGCQDVRDSEEDLRCRQRRVMKVWVEAISPLQLCVFMQFCSLLSSLSLLLSDPMASEGFDLNLSCNNFLPTYSV